ncbi:hypothetical protein [Streptomyces phaeofaciens]|uniref:hypothetical protein n=1 Tax=Streptomyces phaeofaciens TaxID=68254 RepID=UPI0036A3F3C2
MAVVLLLAGAGFAAWRATARDGGGPLDGRPRVSDAAAGISYGIPEGWKAGDEEDLIDAFTSTVSRRMDEDGGCFVLAGRGGAVPQDRLEARAEAAARSNAEFFYPEGGSRIEESRAVEVDGRPAHTVALKVTDGEGAAAGHVRLTLVSVDDSRSAFLLGVAQPGGTQEEREVDAVLESAALL